MVSDLQPSTTPLLTSMHDKKKCGTIQATEFQKYTYKQKNK